MIGESGVGIWIAYAAIVAFLLFLLALVVRTTTMFALLWLAPAAAMLRRVPGLRRLLPPAVAEERPRG